MPSLLPEAASGEGDAGEWPQWRVTADVPVKAGGVFLKGPRTGLVGRVGRAIVPGVRRGEMRNALLQEGQGIPMALA